MKKTKDQKSELGRSNAGPFSSGGLYEDNPEIAQSQMSMPVYKELRASQDREKSQMIAKSRAEHTMDMSLQQSSMEFRAVGGDKSTASLMEIREGSGVDGRNQK